MKQPIVIIIAIVAIVAVAGGAFLLSSNNDDSARTSSGANEQNSSNQGNTSEPEQTPAAPNEVTIKNFAFGPKKITVKKGTTVTWTNQDDARHDITPDEPSDNFKASELLGKGESYSFTFNTAGNYSYHCTPHPYMKGMVEVT